MAKTIGTLRKMSEIRDKYSDKIREHRQYYKQELKRARALFQSQYDALGGKLTPFQEKQTRLNAKFWENKAGSRGTQRELENYLRNKVYGVASGGLHSGILDMKKAALTESILSNMAHARARREIMPKLEKLLKKKK